MLATVVTSVAGLFGYSTVRANDSRSERRTTDVIKYPDLESASDSRQPLFSGATVHDGIVFVAGKGEHGEGDIRVHTEKVLDKIEEELERAGTSMDKALHVNVYLHNLRHYDAMNETYLGRFGDRPPARTTVACYSGVPGNSLVEIDCIAAL